MTDGPEPIAARVGRRLREARLKAGLTIREATKATGISHSMIVKYENGNVAPPLARLDALARLYRIAPAALFATQDAGVDVLSAIDQANATIIELITQALTNTEQLAQHTQAQ